SKDESAKHSGNGVCLWAYVAAVCGGRVCDVCESRTGTTELVTGPSKDCSND
ncbi:MAG: hypothetical protein ACI89X_003113, partial [Planctomycetota bacterium]